MTLFGKTRKKATVCPERQENQKITNFTVVRLAVLRLMASGRWHREGVVRFWWVRPDMVHGSAFEFQCRRIVE
jgi:hypothetical protein